MCSECQWLRYSPPNATSSLVVTSPNSQSACSRAYSWWSSSIAPMQSSSNSGRKSRRPALPALWSTQTFASVPQNSRSRMPRARNQPRVRSSETRRTCVFRRRDRPPRRAVPRRPRPPTSLEDVFAPLLELVVVVGVLELLGRVDVAGVDNGCAGVGCLRDQLTDWLDDVFAARRVQRPVRMTEAVLHVDNDDCGSVGLELECHTRGYERGCENVRDGGCARRPLPDCAAHRSTSGLFAAASVRWPVQTE